VGSKYAGLKGKIPEERSERDVAFQAESAKRKDKTVGELTAEYNVVQEALARLAEKTKTGNLLKRVLEVQIREKLDAQDADSINANGYTWTPTFEPYPGRRRRRIDREILSGERDGGSATAQGVRAGHPTQKLRQGRGPRQ
jgi:hypothetical protein